MTKHYFSKQTAELSFQCNPIYLCLNLHIPVSAKKLSTYNEVTLIQSKLPIAQQKMGV